MRDLTKYRLDSATERLEVAETMIDSGHFRISVTNSYYAMFNAVRALLSEREVDFKKHSAVTSYFRHEYIKTGDGHQKQCYHGVHLLSRSRREKPATDLF